LTPTCRFARRLALVSTICGLAFCSHAQHRTVSGTVTNPFTKEKVSFASVVWKKSRTGTITDSLGHFSLASPLTDDTLVISYSGFKILNIAIRGLHKDTSMPNLYLFEGRFSDSVVVRSRFNKGLLWWKKVVKNQPHNDPYASGAYSCELYNKLEVDINNIDRDAFNRRKLLRPFGFILDNIDSVSEKRPFLPVFMAETISDYFYSARPYQTREEIRAVQTNGIRNEMVLHFMEELHQKVDVYEPYLRLFGKEFISPMGRLGENYYNYRGADTQYIAGQRYLHLFFTPKQQGQNTFSGDCWIHSGSWGIKRTNLQISEYAGINYVHRLDIIQEFTQKGDSSWTLGKDRFIVELSPLKKEKLSLIARRTNMYRNIQFDSTGIVGKLQNNTRQEQVVVTDSALLRDQAWWDAERHEALSANEQKVYKMMDTLKSMPLFHKYVNTVELIVDGRKKLGKVEIGPWYRWVSGNQRERLRLRFDLATTEKFSQYLRLHGYLAYGFRDAAFKGEADATYRLPGSGYTFQGSYVHDLDNGRVRYNDEDPTTDNLFSQLIRRRGVKQKFLQVDEVKASVMKEWENNFSTQVTLSRSAYETFQPLPPKTQIGYNQKDLLNTELAIRLRYAPGENKVTTFRKTHRFAGSSPVIEARYGRGLPGWLGGRYQYDKVFMMVSQSCRVPRWGKVDYRAYGGRIFSNTPLPFMLLELHPGNEIYYYSKQSFNLMNRFEYFSDRFAGFTIEHNFEKKLLNLVPFLRRLNVRQFWNVKTVWGDLNPGNSKLNTMELGNYHLHSLGGRPYTELGTGLDNIFKYFRVDMVWRFSPRPHYGADFGVFGSAHVQF
jgi:hypothetical protein